MLWPHDANWIIRSLRIIQVACNERNRKVAVLTHAQILHNKSQRIRLNTKQDSTTITRRLHFYFWQLTKNCTWTDLGESIAPSWERWFLRERSRWCRRILRGAAGLIPHRRRDAVQVTVSYTTPQTETTTHKSQGAGNNYSLQNLCYSQILSMNT